MDPLQYLKYLVGLLIVLGLIALVTLAARKFGMVPKADRKPGSPKRLSVSDVMSIDAKRRLVLVRRDDQEHLLLLGPERDLVVEQNIPSANIEAETDAKDP
ncbi:flagellar biosynthetic protein FliO [Sneathiella marina]|uniref:Flagellar biosynthetic protein FliO n=1 Tax=Sneathiella marina TaxID=2950108 RepID=A0ABY4VXY5_9PROT|nr:flagellar biosynthetic protein FliO [Sneathiella marina]USG59780.1 flagellar biosynthetic protein FliO [Sneathiella marina]